MVFSPFETPGVTDDPSASKKLGLLADPLRPPPADCTHRDHQWGRPVSQIDEYEAAGGTRTARSGPAFTRPVTARIRDKRVQACICALVDGAFPSRETQAPHLLLGVTLRGCTTSRTRTRAASRSTSAPASAGRSPSPRALEAGMDERRAAAGDALPEGAACRGSARARSSRRRRAGVARASGTSASSASSRRRPTATRTRRSSSRAPTARASPSCSSRTRARRRRSGRRRSSSRGISPRSSGAISSTRSRST